MNNRTIHFFIFVWCILTFCDAKPPEERGPRNEAPPPPVERYLKELKEENPSEFERMVKLRKEDPKAFRMELRKKAFKHRSGEKPKGYKGIHPLKQEIEDVKEAQNPEEKAAAVARLREKITEQVEKNLQEREEAIAKIRAKLKQLEERNEQEQASREEIVDHHIQRILDNLNSFETPPPPAE